MSGIRGLRRMGILILLLTLAVSGAGAQPALREGVLYTERVDATGRRGEVLFVGDDGALTAVPVPSGFYPAGYPDTIALGDLALSADGTKLAGAFYSMSTGDALPAIIADLTLGSCCVVVASPLGQVYAQDLAGFSPDGTQLAFAYTGNSGASFPYTGGLAVADIMTGALVEVAPMEQAMAGREDEGLATWALMGAWTETGIQWMPSCYACEGAYEGEYSLWVPGKDLFLPSSGVYVSPFADTLAGSGETLIATQSAAFPVSPDPGMIPIPNVVQYLPGGVLPTFAALTTAPVVFFDPATLDLGDGAHWVSDGASFLVTPANARTWTLKDRAGATQPLPVAAGTRFLYGSSDGWLAMAPGAASTDLIRTVASPAGAFGAVIDRTAGTSAFPNGYLVLRAPELGEGVPPIAPPAVPPPAIVAPTPPSPVVASPIPPTVQCPGFLPSRLVPGQLARVTPGDPNNLRALPDASAALVGRIPGGSEFMVLTGPICDAAGRAWWQVNYSGLIGWTIEGEGSTYYTEPMAAG